MKEDCDDKRDCNQEPTLLGASVAGPVPYALVSSGTKEAAQTSPEYLKKSSKPHGKFSPFFPPFSSYFYGKYHVYILMCTQLIMPWKVNYVQNTMEQLDIIPFFLTQITIMPLCITLQLFVRISM